MASEGKYFKGDIHTLGNVGIGNLSASYKLDVTGAANISGNLSVGGIPTAPTASAATNNTQLATTQYVTTAINNLIDSSPDTLNTLNELAAALNDDANFAGTITSSIATKLPLAGGTMTGNIVMAGSQTVDGRDLSVDGAKLDGIEASATADQTAAEIRTLVESASDSNVFTDADHSKLNAIEASATADQTASEILTLIKTVDGASSGLDADTLDGSHASTFAPLASPALTGTPTAPTANAGTNTTQIATTAFVNAAVALENSLAEMDDVMLSSVGDGELIVYNSGAWHNKTLTEAGILPLAGGTMTGALTVGVDDTGHDVKFFGATSGSYMLWDESQDDLILGGAARLGIGTTSPATFLEINGGTGVASSGGSIVIRQKGNTYNDGISITSSHANSHRIWKDSSSTLYIGSAIGPDAFAQTLDGNIGIGTTTPAQKLVVQFADTDTSFSGGSGGDWGSEGIRIENTSSTANTMAMLHLRNSDADIHIAGIRQGTDDSDLGFFFEGSEKARLTNAGYLGIGTTAPAQPLDIHTASNDTGIRVYTTPNTRTAFELLVDSATNGNADWKLYHGTVVNTRITSNAGNHTYFNAGNVGIGNTSPASKLHVTGTVQVGVDDTGHDVKFFGATSGKYMLWDESDDILKFPDSTEINLGTGGDLRIYHDGTNNYIKSQNSADLYIHQGANDKDIIFECDDGSGGVETYFYLDGSFSSGEPYTVFPDNSRLAIGTDADFQIRYNGSDTYLQNYTGHLFLINSSNDKDIYFQSDDGSGGVATYFHLDGSYGAGTYVWTSFPDNSIAAFGDGKDLRLYHNGTDSFINNNSGDLNIVNLAADKDILFKADDGSGGIETYFYLDGSASSGNPKTKFPDNSRLGFGADADLYLYHDGSHSYMINDVGHLYIRNQTDDNDIIFQCDDGSGGTETYFRLDGSVGGASPYTVFPDDSRLAFGNVGDGSYMHLLHDATNSYIENKHGHLFISNYADDKDIIFQCDDGSGSMETYFYLDGSLNSGNYPITVFPDDSSLCFGDGRDLVIAHNGTDTNINNYVGHLNIINRADDKDIVFYSDDGSGGVAEYFRLDGALSHSVVSKHIRFEDNVIARFGSGNDASLYHTGSETILENSTGNLSIKNHADDADIVFQCDDGSGGMAQYIRIDGSAGLTQFDKDVKFTDTIKATFGNSSDLQIYHGGGSSRIDDNGDGGLYLRTNGPAIYFQDIDGNAMAQFTDGGACFLMHNGSTKFQTSATGATVTGNLTVSADLIVNGTTTTVNSTTVTIDDPVFTLGGDSAPSSDDNKDRGIEFRYHDGSAAKIGFFGWDDSASVFTFIADASPLSEVYSGSAGNVAFGNIAGTLTTAAQGNITSLGTLTTLTVDDITINGSTISDGGAFSLDVGADITFDAGGGDIILSDDGTIVGTLSMNQNGGDFEIRSRVSDKDLVFKGNDGGSEITALTIDMSAGGNVGIGTTSPLNRLHVETSDSTVARFKSTTNKAAIFVSDDDTGGYFSAESGRVSMGFNSGLHVDNINIHGSGGVYNVGIGTTSPAEKFHVSNGASGFSGTYNARTQAIIESDNSSGTALAIMSKNTGNSAIWFGDEDGETVGQVYYNHPSNYLAFGASGATQAVVNGTGLGIGTTSPAEKLHINGSANGNVKALIQNTNTGSNAYATLGFQNDLPHSVQPALFLNGTNNTNYAGANSLNMYQYGSYNLGFVTNNLLRMTVTGGGDVGIGTSSPLSTLHVATNDATNGDLMIGGNNDPMGFACEFVGNNDTKLHIGRKHSADSEFIERVTILDDGKVGIGTTSPARPLHVNAGATNVVASFESTDAGAYLSFSDDATTDDTYVRLGANGNDFQFFAGGTERVRITSTGFVGIGTNNPQRELEIHGAGNVFARITASTDNDSAALELNNNGNELWTLKADDTASDAFKIGCDGGTALTIDTSKNVGIGTTSPSSKLHVLSGAVSGYSKDTYADIIVEDSDARIQVVSDNGGTNGSSIILTNVDSGTHSNWAIGQTTTGNSNKLHIGHNTSSGGDVSSFSSTQDLVITTDGKVGIGTTSPASLLDVRGTVQVGVDDTGHDVKFYGATSGTYFHWDESADKLILNEASLQIVDATPNIQLYDSDTANQFNIDFNGADVTFKAATPDGDIIFQADNGSGGLDSYFRVDGGDHRTHFFKQTRHYDNIAAKFGASDDLSLYHSGSHSYISNNTGNLYITNYADDQDILFGTDDGSGSTETYFFLDGSANSGNPITKFPDSSRLVFGDAGAGDMALYHDGTNNYINTYTGDLILRVNANDKDIIFQSDDGSGGTETYFYLDGSVSSGNPFTIFPTAARCAWGNSAELQITHTGTDSYIANYTGHLYVTNDANDKDIIFQCDDGSGGLETYFYLDGSASSGNPITIFPDNSYLQFGTGMDLGIVHNGTNALISNTTGNIKFTNYADDADIKFECDDGSGGVTEYFRVDGGATNILFSKELRLLDGVQIQLGTSLDMLFMHNGANGAITNNTGNLIIKNNNDDGDIIFECDDGSGGIAEYFRLDGGLGYLFVSKTLNFADNVPATFGPAGDLNIRHDGTDSSITNNTGDLYVRNTADDKDIIFKADAGGTEAEIMRIDGSTGSVCIGTTDTMSSANARRLVVGDGAGTEGITIYSGNDSSGWLAFADGTSGDQSYRGIVQYSHANDAMSFHTQGTTERMRLNSTGLGIGTTSPAHRLDVVGTYRISDNTTNANNKLHRMLGRHYTNAEQDVNIFSSISTSSTNVVSFGGGSSSYNTATHILFYTASNNTSTYAVGQERFRIHNDGNIGIAVGSPQQKLDVDGAIKSKIYTVNTLPTANSSAAGARAFVSDSQMSASGNFGATIAGYGSGSYTVPVWCDGSYWYIG